ncbi:MAG: PfkB family carbohydrate kinase [Shimia sp.]
MAPVIPGEGRFDALVIGRAGMDLYPTPLGTTTDQAEHFLPDLGGSASNIAVAMARAGARVSLAAPLSADPVGDFVATRLERHGVHHATPQRVAGQARTSLAVAEVIAEGSRTVIYRNGAADFEMPPLTVDARVVVVTGTALAAEPSRSEALKAMGQGFSVLDLDYRPYSWASQEEAGQVYARAVGQADIVVGNDEEFAILDPARPPREVAEGLGATRWVLFKEGARGCTLFTPEGTRHIPVFEVAALKPFGAGDAFLGTSLAALLTGAGEVAAFTRGAAAAAIVVTRPGCASAMPTPAEIDTFMQEHR